MYNNYNSLNTCTYNIHVHTIYMYMQYTCTYNIHVHVHTIYMYIQYTCTCTYNIHVNTIYMYIVHTIYMYIQYTCILLYVHVYIGVSIHLYSRSVLSAQERRREGSRASLLIQVRQEMEVIGTLLATTTL